MASFVGHSLAALAAVRAPAGKNTRRLLFSSSVTLAAVILANLPDFDMPARILLKPFQKYSHRGPSHSLVFTVGLAISVWLVASRVGKRGGRTLFFAFLAAALAHPLIDYLMGNHPGVQLFWPFSQKEYVGPVRLEDQAPVPASIQEIIDLLIGPKGITAIIFDLFMLVPILLAQKYAFGRPLKWMAYLAVSIATIAAAYFTYESAPRVSIDMRE